MTYKWKPNATQRKEYAEMMNDPIQRAEYEERKREKARKKEEKNRAGSRFDYLGAGGNYVPTKWQYYSAWRFISYNKLSEEDQLSCSNVMSAYTMNKVCHHDDIHVVNELRKKDLLDGLEEKRNRDLIK